MKPKQELRLLSAGDGLPVLMMADHTEVRIWNICLLQNMQNFKIVV